MSVDQPRWSYDDSVHSQSWPTPTGGGGDAALLEPISEALGAVRRAKTEAKVSQKAAVALIAVRAPAEQHDHLRAGERDLCAAGSIAEVRYEVSDAFACEVTLAPVPA